MGSKRILLTHISNISGHRSASLSIEKAIKIMSPQTQTLSLNAFHYVHPRGERIINFLYMLTIQKLPFIWAHLYDNPYWNKRTKGIKEFIHRYNFPKLKVLFGDFKPDVVVATQAFPCGMVADFKRAEGIELPLVAVLTDFAPHSYWIYDNVDYYIVPSEEIKQKLIQKGISPERIKTLGIPFNPKFNRILNKAEVRKKLKLEESLFTILIMGGGQGLGPLKKVVKVLDNLNFDFQEIVVCGTNKRLYRWLKKRQNSYKKNILLFGYADNMEELMSAADIIITKPGGITCAEALSKGLPMLIMSPIPGQEANNASFLTRQGTARKINKTGDLAGIISELYNHPEQMKELSEAALKIAKPNAAGDIARLLLAL
ncbi:MAG: glycosyltransferase [Candidatus Omnitrophota bacterium]